MIVKPWQAGVRGYVGAYRPCSSVKYPSLGIAFAAGLVQSFALAAFDMWLLMPIGQSSAKRVMWARHGTGGLYTRKLPSGRRRNGRKRAAGCRRRTRWIT